MLSKLVLRKALKNFHLAFELDWNLYIRKAAHILKVTID